MWKDFFKPTKTKIITALIIPVLLLIERLYRIKTWCPPCNRPEMCGVCPPSPFTSYESVNLIIKVIIFSFIIVYLLVCIIIWLYRKLKK